MKKILLFAAACLGLYSCSDSALSLVQQDNSLIKQSLNQNWQFKDVDSTAWLNATVPGVVHTDLLNLEIIENPFNGTAEPKLQWIEKKTWEYQANFTPDNNILDKEEQILVLEGVDTYADVYVNDELVQKTDNMFLAWRIDVKGKIKSGENKLRVVFHPAYDVAEPLAKKYPKLPADNDKGEPYKTSVFTRKAPYSYGWDWGPRYATVGLWRPVMLEGYNTLRIESTQVIQKTQSQELATLDMNVAIEANKEGEVMIAVADTMGNIFAKKSLKLVKGINIVNMPFQIENPKLWWPNGSGEPNLYALQTMVVDHNGAKLDSKTERIGIRTVRWVQEPDSVGNGKSFYVEVNGVPIFSKGANYIPQDSFLPRVTSERYEEIVNVTKESNMNILRVWGGGIYENDEFYELCDENGIMVWQDFIFGCSLYPWDKEFFANVEKEAVENVKRLRNHPSIVLWCGNNEITELWHHWGYQKVYKWTETEQKEIFAGMEALFYELLPNVLKNQDTTRYYHPSSPTYGRGNPQSQIEGDVHYWGVFHDEEPFSVYKDKPGRYSNEYGFQSLACYDTYREYFEEKDMKLYSDAMVIHQKNFKGYRVIEEYMSRDLPILKDNFRTYVYLTQILQQEGIKIAMEGHRSRRPWTMGSLYWQLNDLWPVASWSSLDSEGRWKALQFQAKRSFAPTILSFERVDSTATCRLWGITDKLDKPQTGKISVTLMDFEGKKIKEQLVDVEVEPNTSEMLFAISDLQLLEGNDPSKVLLVAEGELSGTPVRAIYYFTQFKNLDLPEPKYDVQYTQKDNVVTAKITAKTMLKSVLFEADALQNNPSDGYFDMLAGETKTVILNFIENKSVEEYGIFVTTLNPLVHQKGSQPIKHNVK